MQLARALAAGSLAMLAAPALAYDLPADTDPVFAEAFNGCLAAIAGGGFMPEEMGWIGHDSGDPDAVAWDYWSRGFATKDIADAGALNLSALVEDHVGYELGHCSVEMRDARREIDGPNLKRNGYPGTLQGDAGDWSGVWRDEAGQLFLRATLSASSNVFALSMTKITIAPVPVQ